MRNVAVILLPSATVTGAVICRLQCCVGRHSLMAFGMQPCMGGALISRASQSNHRRRCPRVQGSVFVTRTCGRTISDVMNSHHQMFSYIILPSKITLMLVKPGRRCMGFITLGHWSFHFRGLIFINCSGPPYPLAE